MKIDTRIMKIRMNTQAMIDRLQSLNQDDLLDRVADALAHIDEVQTARDWIDSIHEADERLYEQVLDAISDSYQRATGEWEDDDDGNMVMLLRCDWCEDSDDFLDMDMKFSETEYGCSICKRTITVGEKEMCKEKKNEEMDCDECGVVDETVGYVDDEMSYKLCEHCDREYLHKQGYE